MDILDEQVIYQISDSEIIGELQRRLAKMRRSCCFSQQKLADLSGVSIATIKRLESGMSPDMSIAVVIRLLRTMTRLEGVGQLVPEVPESPFLMGENGRTAVRISSKMNRR